MRVYICYLDYGCEGKGEPLHAFSDAAIAEAWLEGTKDASGISGKVKVLETIGSISKSEEL